MAELEQNMRMQTVFYLPFIDDLVKEITISNQMKQWLAEKRQAICRIITGQDPRLLVIVGPCSIHDVDAALDYAQRLARLNRYYQDKLLLVMRTYFEKPRTRQGWQGLLTDPYLNGSYCVQKGLRIVRQFLKQVLELKLPTATEFLDTLLAPYFADLICWGSIGARTVGSQPHRQLASALPCAVGFKNNTEGNILMAIDAICAARTPQLFCHYCQKKAPEAIITEGNPFGHIILRGGIKPNYYQECIQTTCQQLNKAEIKTGIIIDCSHGNSRKKAINQPFVAENIINQLLSGEKSIAGIMLESFLIGGRQAENNSLKIYGQSITDECLSWDETDKLLARIYHLIV